MAMAMGSPSTIIQERGVLESFKNVEFLNPGPSRAVHSAKREDREERRAKISFQGRISLADFAGCYTWRNVSAK